MSMYSKSPKVGNPIASILKGNVKGIPALFGLNPVSNSIGFTIKKSPVAGSLKGPKDRLQTIQNQGVGVQVEDQLVAPRPPKS